MRQPDLVSYRQKAQIGEAWANMDCLTYKLIDPHSKEADNCPFSPAVTVSSSPATSFERPQSFARTKPAGT